MPAHKRCDLNLITVCTIGFFPLCVQCKHVYVSRFGNKILLNLISKWMGARKFRIDATAFFAGWISIVTALSHFTKSLIVRTLFQMKWNCTHKTIYLSIFHFFVQASDFSMVKMRSWDATFTDDVCQRNQFNYFIKDDW